MGQTCTSTYSCPSLTLSPGHSPLSLPDCLYLTAMLWNKRAKTQPQAALDFGCQHFLLQFTRAGACLIAGNCHRHSEPYQAGTQLPNGDNPLWVLGLLQWPGCQGFAFVTGPTVFVIVQSATAQLLRAAIDSAYQPEVPRENWGVVTHCDHS